jgi:hypothetical protein
VIGRFKNKFLIGIALAALFTVFCYAAAFAKADTKILLNIPMNNFVLPVFDENGKKMWEAHGSSATLEENDLLIVNDVRLSCFAGADTLREAFFATSDSASIRPAIHRAFGNSKIKIFGANFCASADNWEFFGDSKKIIARDNVRVLLEENMAEFLK